MEQLRRNDPRTLGPFRIVGRLGSGGMGQVLLGVDTHGRRVACKIVHAELAADPGFRGRFRREIEIATAAPRLVTAPFVAADPDAERPWLATAFIDGPSLKGLVEQRGPLPSAEIPPLAGRIAAALAALHAAGVVHRDLKPSNVLLDAHGPRLIDFGIARAADSTTMTITGHVLGTPSFMSPEQVDSTRGTGAASDVFSFGSLIVYLGTGRSPFESDSVPSTLYKVAHGTPDLDGVAGPLREAVLACLRRDPRARPTAAQLEATFLHDAPLPAAPGAVPVAGPPESPVGRGPDPSADAASTDPPTRDVPPSRPGSSVPGASVPATGSRRPRQWPWALAAAAAVVAAGAFAIPAVLSEWNTVPPGVILIDAEADGRFGTGGARFTTPSGNVACLMSNGVRCDVLEHTWDLPPKPSDCEFDFGVGAQLVGTGAGELSCVDDTVAGSDFAVLDYGAAVEYDGVVCVSREAGLRCRDRTTAHGFTVARAAYSLF